MRNFSNLVGLFVLGMFTLVVTTGCPQSKEPTTKTPPVDTAPNTPDKSPSSPGPTDATPPAEESTPKPPKEENPKPVEPTTPVDVDPAPEMPETTVKVDLSAMPKVVWKPTVMLSDTHGKTCKINMGEQFPEMTLKGVDGEEHKLSDLLGKKMTVVVFWNKENPYALEQFQRLGREVADRYPGWGIKVVAVNVGDEAEEVEQLAKGQQVDFPVLIDVDSEAMKNIAEDILPRTYLLDEKGRVLWFDIEYSRSTSRELRNAIGYQFRGRAA